MNAARLNKSDRLQRVLNALKQHGWQTTMQLVRRANVCAVNNCVAELRTQGYDIECQR